jgi:hypothetical protein
MTASYPGTVQSFTTKVDGTSIIYAAHPNLLQDEVVAIESILGVNPHIDASSVNYGSVDARLRNIETGVTGDSHTQYVKVAGGSTITISTATTKGVIVKGAASQTANLQEWQNSSGTVLADVDAAGNLQDAKMTKDINNLFVLSYVFG